MTIKDVLEKSTVDALTIKLPAEVIPKEIYNEISDLMLEKGGKKTSGKSKTFIFESDPSNVIGEILTEPADKEEVNEDIPVQQTDIDETLPDTEPITQPEVKEPTPVEEPVVQSEPEPAPTPEVSEPESKTESVVEPVKEEPAIVPEPTVVSEPVEALTEDKFYDYILDTMQLTRSDYILSVNAGTRPTIERMVNSLTNHRIFCFEKNIDEQNRLRRLNTVYFVGTDILLSYDNNLPSLRYDKIIFGAEPDDKLELIEKVFDLAKDGATLVGIVNSDQLSEAVSTWLTDKNCKQETVTYSDNTVILLILRK